MSYEVGNVSLMKTLCMEIGQFLQNKYPHVAWGVKPTVDGSMVQIVIVGAGTDPDKQYQIATKDIQQTTGRNAKLVAIGGEILERYKIHRSKKEFEGAMPSLSKRGFLMPDMS